MTAREMCELTKRRLLPSQLAASLGSRSDANSFKEATRGHPSGSIILNWPVGFYLMRWRALFSSCCIIQMTPQ